jgi:hypothetical protein
MVANGIQVRSHFLLRLHRVVLLDSVNERAVLVASALFRAGCRTEYLLHPLIEA